MSRLTHLTKLIESSTWTYIHTSQPCLKKASIDCLVDKQDDDVTHRFNLLLGLVLHSLLNNVSVQDIASGLEREGQTWERLLLWTTGSKLELSKYLYYIIYYIFDPAR